MTEDELRRQAIMRFTNGENQKASTQISVERYNGFSNG
jgi:hypothetical protein